MTEAWVIKVFGVVQGVGFRYYAARLAESFGLVGWARNQGSSTMEVLIQGEQSVLEVFEKELVVGPRGARIDSWDRRVVPLRTDLNGFSILSLL